MRAAATIWLDVICPFCYLAERVLARLEEEGAVEVRVRPFELHPETPREGRRIADMVPKSRADAIYREVRWIADEVGARVAQPERLPNSRLALEAIEMGRAAGGEAGAARLARRLFAAYFVEGRDIGDEAVLRAIATGEGIPRPLQDRCFVARGFRGAVDAARREAEGRLVMAVPAMDVGSAPLVGFQPYVRVKQALERMRQ